MSDDTFDRFAHKVSYASGIVDIVQWIADTMFRAGCKWTRENPGANRIVPPDAACLSYHVSYGVRARLKLEKEYMLEDFHQPSYELKLRDDSQAYQSEILRSWLRHIFPNLVFENDLRVCEANLTRGPQEYTLICEDIDGVWTCSQCREEKEEKLSAGLLYLIGSWSAGYCQVREDDESGKFTLIERRVPFKLERLSTIPADNRRAFIRAFGEAFETGRRENDWFQLSGEEMARVKAIARFRDGEFLDEDGNRVDLAGDQKQKGLHHATQ